MRLFVSVLLILASSAYAQPQGVFGRLAPPASPSPSSVAGLPDGFYLQNAASGASFVVPVAVAPAPDGRLFVVEKRGRIYIVQDGIKLETPFLALDDEVLDHADRGLLGFALDPDFATNGHVYLYYAVDHDGTGDRDRFDAFARLTRYTASVADPNVADPDSRRVLLGETFSTGVPACYFSHNGGALAFGTDGTLLLTTGDAASYDYVDDGGRYDDCFGPGRFDSSEDIGSFRSGRVESLAGKVLRLDPATGRGLASNPFYTGDPDDNASRVWAMGVRNAFRAALRADGSTNPADGRPGTMYLGDVGWYLWEELQPVRGGEYFGWPCFEGPNAHPDYPTASPATNGCGTVPAPTAPPYYWNHEDPSTSSPEGLLGFAIVGGDFYEGTRYPAAYQNALFYGDYAAQWLAVAQIDPDGDLTGHTVFGEGTGFIVDMTYNPVEEEMLLVDVVQGVVNRLRYAPPGSNSPPVAIASPSPPEGPAPLFVSFTGADSFDPDGDPLTFAWDFGDGTRSSYANPNHTFQDAGLYPVMLTVSDPSGATGFTTLTVLVGDGTGGPQAAILAPTNGSAVSANETLILIGDAADPDQPASTLQYQWSATQIHNGHEHFDFLNTEGATATFNVPAHGDDGDLVYYRLTLTVTDNSGLTDEASVTVRVRNDDELDVTDEALRPIAKIMNPIGGGSRDLEIIRDGVAPPVGFDEPAFQYDTFTGQGGTRPTDWIGYEFGETRRFTRLSFQEGCHFGDGGWFENFRVEVRQGNQWVEAPFLSVFPDYRGHDEVNYDTYELAFKATEGEAIRIKGRPGGSAHFISVGELRVFTLDAELPPPPSWSSTDVGPVVIPGSTTQDGGVMSIEASGDLWGDLDAFQYAYQIMSGDGTLTARLESFAASHEWAKAGLMVRASLDPQSAHAMVVGTPQHGVNLQARPSHTAGTEWLASVGGATIPSWIRIQRMGTTVTGYTSPDGTEWTVVGSAEVELGPDVLIGFAVTSTDWDNQGVSALARFDEVLFDGLLDPQPPAPTVAPVGPSFTIDSVYPNPFNPSTTVRLAIDQPGFYRIEVYDILGRRVLAHRLREEAPGLVDLRLDLTNMASGSYLIRAFRVAGGAVAMRQVTLLR